jgi:hypothetical protein
VKTGEYIAWARKRASPRDLLPIGIGGWLLKSGIENGNEMFVFISLYLFGLIPAWWADKDSPLTPPDAPSGPPSPSDPSGGD